MESPRPLRDRFILSMRFAVMCAVLLGTSALPVFAQGTVGQPVTIGDVVVSGSLRTRTYTWH